MGTYRRPQPAGPRFPVQHGGNSSSQRRLRHRVEVQSIQIERVLAKHNIQAEVDGGSIRSQWTNFDLQAQMSGGWQRLRQLKDELVDVLGVPEVNLTRENGALRLSVRRDVPHPVDLLDLLAASPSLAGVPLTLGVNEEGQPVMLNLSSPDIHNILVAGVDGAGKSSLLRSIAVSLALANRQSDVQIGVISAGGRSRGLVSKPHPLTPLNYLPHILFPVATNVEEAADSLAFLADEISYRQENKLTTPLMVILVDDVDWLLSAGGRAISQPLARLLEATPESGLRTIVSATEPTQKDLAQLLKHNAPLRLVGRLADANHAFALTGEPDSGAEYLNGRGDFLAVSYASMMRFQAAFIDDYDLHLTLSEIHRPQRAVLLARSKIDVAEATEEQSIVFAFDSDSNRATLSEEQAEVGNSKSGVVIDHQASSEPSIDETDEEWLIGVEDEAEILEPRLLELEYDELDEDEWNPEGREEKPAEPDNRYH